MTKGIVYLVGAGPGDPGLITLKGVECLRQADVVVYDHLANERLLRHTSPKAKIIYAGKKARTHTLVQEKIERLLIKAASRGKVVVRLKGGDPFVFGRGGEEAEALASARIRFEIVPGITSAIAVPAYAGIPVTHRNFTSTVAFVTGHEKDLPQPPPYQGGGEVGIPWSSLAKIESVVFLMGVQNLPVIVNHLTQAGRDPATPVAVIEWGTLPSQRIVEGTLQSIVQKVQKGGIHPPAVTVVGPIVHLREKIAWFEKKPLFGKRILVTRSRAQASALSKRLIEAGADVIEIPTIEIRPPAGWKRLDQAIRDVAKYHWLIFTSVNGVDSFFNRLLHRGHDLRELTGLKIAAIGPATAKSIEERGLRVDSIAEEYRAEGVVRILARQKLKGKKILIPRAFKAREILVDELKRLGARVTVVEAYRTVAPRLGRGALREAVARGIDMITFASSSTVENFIKMAGGKIPKVPVASIGPITTDTAKRLGLPVVLQPKRYTIPDLVEAIVGYFYGTSGS